MMKKAAVLCLCIALWSCAIGLQEYVFKFEETIDIMTYGFVSGAVTLFAPWLFFD